MEIVNVRPDAATGTTTAKEMTKTEVKENKMFAIKENIEDAVIPLAELCFKFENSVNEIIREETGFGQIVPCPEQIVRHCCTELCEKIMLSRLSADDKLDTLRRLDLLVYYAYFGGQLTICSKDEKQWENFVRNNAYLCIDMEKMKKG